MKQAHLETDLSAQARIDVKTTAVVRVISIDKDKVVLQPQGEHPVTLKTDDELVITQEAKITKD